MTLWSARHTLTELTIEYNEEPVLPLITVLQVCPNLLHLSYTARNLQLEGVSESLPRCSQSESLTISVKSIADKELEAVLQWCPRLKRLVILGCKPAALSLIERMLPQLKVLNFNMADYGKTSITQETHTGLQTLCIRQHPNTQGGDVFAFLEKSQKSVERLKIGFPHNITTGLQAWNALANLKLNVLREALFVFDSAARAIVVNLLEESPALEFINFVACDLTAQVFDAVAKLSNLRKLHIDKPESMAGPQTFFRKHVALGAASPLREVMLSGCSSAHDDVLAPLAGLTTLESIEIRECRGFTVEGVNQFVEALSNLAELKSLTFSGMDSVTDKAITMLADIENLTMLCLFSLPKIIDEGISELRDTALLLDDLLISDCKGVSDKTTDEVWTKIWKRERARSAAT